MMQRTPTSRPLPSVTLGNNLENLLPFPTTSGASIPSTRAIDELAAFIQTYDVHNSTLRTQSQQINNNNISTTSVNGNISIHSHNISGVVPITEPSQNTTSVAVLQNVVSHLQAEIEALRAERQHLLRITSTVLRPPGTNLAPANFPRNTSSTWTPRELFPAATVTSQAANSLTACYAAPCLPAFVSATQASGLQSAMSSSLAREPYAHSTVPLPTHTSPPHTSTQSLPTHTCTQAYSSNNLPVYSNAHTQAPLVSTYSHIQPSSLYHTYTIPVGNSNMSYSNSMRLYDLSRIAKSWNISFPPRDRSSSIDARKYIKIIEQRMISNDIPVESFHAVVTNTLNGDVLEWYYQNEDLFFSWATFKEYFKIWQVQKTDEAVLQEIYSAKQGNDEKGVSFINRMQGAFSRLEDPLPQAKQIRIIVSRFNSYFLQKFSDTTIEIYAELYTRVSAWQPTADALNPHFKLKEEINSRQKIRSQLNLIKDTSEVDQLHRVKTLQSSTSSR